ncbi:MAG: MFS transporter [Candidatus Hydrogenedentes bacterium]|nr:MFS transporter [Candidatus Hydrogenedentota bacterium]
MTDVLFGKKKWTDGLTGYHWLVLVVVSLGWMFDTMDQWLYVAARQPALKDLVGPEGTPEQLKTLGGIVNGVFIFGWATGGFLFGMVGDKLGRTMTMAITVLVYAVFTGLSGLATNWEMFAFFRFLTGLGIGGEFAAGAALVAEVFPDHARPVALGIMQACSAIGNILAGVISLTVFQTIGSEDNWRYIFFVGFVPALLVFIIRLFVREPEQWHAAKQEAKSGDIKLGSIAALFSDRELRSHTIVGVCLAAVGVVGFWGIGTFSLDFLRGLVNPESAPELRGQADKFASYAIMIQNAGAFFGILTWAWFAQRIGRKPTFAVAFTACAIVVPLTFNISDSPAVVLCMVAIMGFFLTSLFGGYAVYFPELFPTRLRATGTGFCYNVARYISISGPWTFGILSAKLGFGWSAALMSIVFLLGLLVLPFAPETRGKRLPS